MSLAYCATDLRDNTCRPTAAQTHFNVGLAQLQPNHGIECLLFFWCVKNTCHLHQSYHPAFHTPASFSHTHWQRHEHCKRWAIVADIWPALNQHCFNASCWTGLEQCSASVSVRQWWDSDGSLLILFIY